MAAASLEVSRSAAPTYPLDAQLRLRALLRPARGRIRLRATAVDVDGAAAPDPGRPAEHLALRGLPAAGDAAGRSAAPRALACRPAARRWSAPTGSPSASASSEVWVKNDAANPTHSFKDRVVSVAAARAPRARLRDAGLRLDRQPRQRRRRARRQRWACESYVFIPADLEEQKILATGVYGTNLVKVRGNYDDVNRLCTELSGEQEAGRSSTSTCGPYYAEGSKTLAYEIAEQLGLADARTGSSRRSPRARCSPRSPRASRSGSSCGLIEGELPTMNGAQAEGCSPVATAFAAGADVCRPVKPDTIAKSLAIGNPADGPYALDLARTTGGGIDAVTDDEIRARHPAARRDDGHLHRDRRRRHDRDAGEARRARRHRLRRAGRARDHRRGPQDARRRARHVRVLRDRPGLRAFEQNVDAGGARSDGGHRQAADAAARRRRRRLRRSRSTGATVGEVARRRSTTSTPSCATGSPTKAASCAASSTSTSAARTSASSTASTRPSLTAARFRSCRRSPAASGRRGSRNIVSSSGRRKRRPLDDVTWMIHSSSRLPSRSRCARSSCERAARRDRVASTRT